jgi:hypothetical protein
METNEKIIQIVNENLLVKKTKDVLLITLTFISGSQIEILFRHPRWYTLIAYRSICGVNNIDKEHEDPFDNEYHIVYNGKNFIEGLSFLDSYLKNDVEKIDYKLIAPKQTGCEENSFFFV